MTDLFDGVSFIIEKNSGETQTEARVEREDYNRKSGMYWPGRCRNWPAPWRGGRKVQERIYNQLLREVLEETAEILLTGRTQRKISLGLTTYGSEIAAEELLQGALAAMQREPGLQVSIIGPAPPVMICRFIKHPVTRKFMRYWENSWRTKNWTGQ
jgi:hypothetical protein